MFTITAKQPINWTWASFKLDKGTNEFTSRAEVPPELWPKLKRLRELDVVAFESEFDNDGKLVAHESDQVKLEELSERHLYAMNKDELADLAQANGVEVKAADAQVGLKKKDLLDALVAKLPKREPPAEQVKPEGEAPVAGKRGRGGKGGTEPPPASPVTVG